MGDNKKSFKFGFKKKEKESPMFKSPSHYWNASQTDFLHSKGSANVELSIDPFNKALIRIFCQSIDKMVNYKSIEYCARTTVQQIIDKMIKVLRLNKPIDNYLLVESVGRCLLIEKDGSTGKTVAKSGQPSIYIEQNRRVLMNTDYILTVLNYWKPMAGFCRRFDLCSADQAHQMMSCDGQTNGKEEAIPQFFDNHDSISTLSQKSNLELEHKYTQTETQSAPPVAPRRRISMKTPKIAHLLTLKGDDFEDHDLLLPLTSILEFGSPGSGASIILNQLSDLPNQKICIITKTSPDNSKDFAEVYFENVCTIPDLCVSINGREVADKVLLQPGDIISIGEYYSYYFKDKHNKIKHFINNHQKRSNVSNHNANHSSDVSDPAVTSSSISSCSEVLSMTKSGRLRKKVSIDIHGISLACFDTALNQIIIHYFDGQMDLNNAVVFALYLIRFCRESTRCSFSLQEMQDRIRKRFSKSLEMAYNNDYYLLGSLKLTAFTFQLWLIYNNENYIETTEENRHWLDFLESFTAESFDHLSNYICETSQNLSTCFFEENPFLNFDEQQKYQEDEDINTMAKLLDFLNDTFQNISKIGSLKMNDILKSVFTSRIVTFITESTVIQLLSDMRGFNWNKGIQVSSQLEKFENWLTDEGVISIFESDGFLRDFSRLISTRAVVLKQMDWRTIRQNYNKIPLSVLSQFLSGLASDHISILSIWQPTATEISEANRDVVDVLSQYLRSVDNMTLFQPGIILQTDCVPVDKLIQSMDFIALCTVLDTELIAMGETFQWMSLPKPQSLVNFKNHKWAVLRESIGMEHMKQDVFTPKGIKKMPLGANRIQKKQSGRKMQTDSDYSSISHKDINPTPCKDLVARYYRLKSNLNNFSKSMVSLNEPEIVPTVPQRKKTKGSFSNLSKPTLHSEKNGFLSPTSSKSRGSIGHKSCFGRIGRSDSTTSDLVSPPAVVDIDTDTSSVINDVDQCIEEMEQEIQHPGSVSKYSRFHANKSSLSPSTENGFEDDDDEMSVGLSAAELMKRIGFQSKSFDALDDIDNRKQVEILLTKSTDESYGITLADGAQTNLKMEGIFIYKITKFSPAHKNGLMKPGDRIMAINNYTVNELSFEQCLMLITKSVTSVKLLIEKSDLKTTLGIMSIYQ